MKGCVVLTTINVPELLYGYADNFEKFGHSRDVGFVVIGDLKTPPEARKVLDDLRDRGMQAHYLDIPDQESWMKKFPVLSPHIPYNTDGRRNIGYLIAAEMGAEIIIALDDDNYVTEDDYFGYHSIVGRRCRLETVSSSDGWYNLCELLQVNPARPIYPRGFPYSKRWKERVLETSLTEGRVVLHAGLWLGDPDVDAVTRLNEPLEVTGLVRDEPLMLAPGTYCTVNTQNTSFHRELLPVFYYVIMGLPWNGLRIDRYGDIWAGYFAQKVIAAVGDRISVGRPLTRHVRNTHNLLWDLQQELGGMVVTQSLVEILDQISLRSTNYEDAYLELANAIRDFAGKDGAFSAEVKACLTKITEVMPVWVKVCRQIMGG